MLPTAIRQEPISWQQEFDKTIVYVDEVSRKIGNLVYENLLLPSSIGAVVGLGQFTFSMILAAGLQIFEAAETLVDEEAAEMYGEYISHNLFDVAVKGPIIEEIIFRVIIQGSLNFIADKILPDVNVHIFSHSIKLAALVSIVATSVLFGAAHISNGLGIAQVLICTLSGIVFGLLKNEYGIVASTTAHITNNTLALGLIKLAGG